MLTHCRYDKTHNGVLAFLFLVIWCASAQAQQPNSDNLGNAVELLNGGDVAGAVKSLRAATKSNKNDLRSWHWLGVALERQGKSSDSRKAHERAAKLGEALLMNEVDSEPFDEVGNAIARLKPQLTLASESAEAYLRLSSKLSKSQAAEWQDRSGFLRDYQDFPQISGLTIYKSKEVTTKARVLAKPEPTYTEEARRHGTTGTVVLRLIFAEDGTVRAIFPLVRLPHGLTAQSIKAARAIRFVPASKDGKPVSMWMQVEYNFNLY